MQFRYAVVCLVLLAGCSRPAQRPPDGGAQKQAGRGITMFVQGGKGSAVIPIENNGDNPASVNLSSSPVTDATTGSEITGAVVSFATESGGQPIVNVSAQGNATAPPANQTGNAAPGAGGTNPKPAQPVTVPAHSKMNVQVKVSGLTGTTWAKMSVYNQGADVGNLDLVVLDDPLNVAIDGLGAAATTPLAGTYGNTVTFTLKNNSAEFLALDCEVELRDSPSSCGRIVLPPNAAKAVPVDLVWGAFSWTDLVQPSSQTGGLRLTLQVPPGTPAEMVPVKVLPLNITLQAAGPIWLSLLSLIYVGAFLALGGYLSVLASTVLPNMVKKAELRKQVNELANRTSSVSTKVDSYLRVLLRLERKKIHVLLDNLSGFSPSASEQFADIATLTSGLMKRLTVAERLDKLRRAFEDKSATAPPSISDGIDKNLDTAAGQLHSFVLNDADVVASNAYLDKAEGLLKLLDDKDAQARLIAQNYVQLRNRIQAFPADYSDLKEALSGIFDSLNFGKKNSNGANPPANAPNPGEAGNPGAGSGAAGNAGAGPVPNTDAEGNAPDAGASPDVAKPVDTGNSANTGDAGAAGAGATPDPASNPVPDAPGDQPAAPSVTGDPNDPLTAGPAAGTDAVADAGKGAPPDASASAQDADAATGGPAASTPPAAKPAGGSPNDFSDPKNIIAPMFFAVDHGIAAIQTVLDYAIVRASVATGMSKNCQAPGQDAMKRLKDHECQLLSLLGTLSWKSLRGAITLVQQMREDVYEEDVYQHVKAQKARIVFDTQRARPFLPVFFTIGFDDPRLNGAAALDWVALDWTFPNELHEAGWKICHYFDGKEGTAEVVTTGQNDSDPTRRNVPIKLEAKSPRWQEALPLNTRIEVQPENPKAERAGVFADRLRFGIAFGVALASLKSGALDQLAKLGFVQATVAIIALGFGADTVKNILTQSSKPQPAPAPPPPPAAPKTGP